MKNTFKNWNHTFRFLKAVFYTHLYEKHPLYLLKGKVLVLTVFMNDNLQGSFFFKTLDTTLGCTLVYRDLKIVVSGFRTKRV